jgi:dihydroxyacetone kinase
MAGISISVLGLQDGWLSLLDAPTSALAWPNVSKQRSTNRAAEVAPSVRSNLRSLPPQDVHTETALLTKGAILAACDALIAAESELTEMDRIVGDGDLGTSMKRAAAAVKDAVATYPLDDIAETFRALGHTLRHELGGSSGPLYGVLFLRAGNVMENSGRAGLPKWIEALEEGSRAISDLGGAKPGDRTMMDALYPFVMSLKSAGTSFSPQALRAAVAEAKRGADATAQMKPRLGRSSYLQDRVLGHPDPGAIAVVIWLRAVTAVLAGTLTSV